MTERGGWGGEGNRKKDGPPIQSCSGFASPGLNRMVMFPN